MPNPSYLILSSIRKFQTCRLNWNRWLIQPTLSVSSTTTPLSLEESKTTASTLFIKMLKWKSMVKTFCPMWRLSSRTRKCRPSMARIKTSRCHHWPLEITQTNLFKLNINSLGIRTPVRTMSLCPCMTSFKDSLNLNKLTQRCQAKMVCWAHSRDFPGIPIWVTQPITSKRTRIGNLKSGDRTQCKRSKIQTSLQTNNSQIQGCISLKNRLSREASRTQVSCWTRWKLNSPQRRIQINSNRGIAVSLETVFLRQPSCSTMGRAGTTLPWWPWKIKNLDFRIASWWRPISSLLTNSLDLP